MAKIDWDKYPDATPQKSKQDSKVAKIDWDAYPDAGDASEKKEIAENVKDPKKSKITALTTGIMNPFGLADEMAAAGSTAMNAISGMSGPMAGGSVKDLVKEYRSTRDKNRKEFEEIQAANPKTNMVGKLIGGVATGGMAGAAPKTLMGTAAQGATIGGVTGLGESNADLTKGEIKQAAMDAGKGVALGTAGGVVGYGIGKGVSSLVDGSLSRGLKNVAEKNAVKATGATGKQVSTFDKNAGRELLDRKVVRFGDSPQNIADKAQNLLDEAHSHMDEALTKLDAKGVKANAENVIKELEDKVATLRKDPAQADVVRKLTGIVDDIKNTGETSPVLSAAENTKRGFGRIAKNWQDPEKGQAGKAAYLSYRDEVERAAIEADPALAKIFIDGKKTHGLLDPIQEAAERRAATLQQSPYGGLKDAAALTVGVATGNPTLAMAAPISQRIFAPRIAASVAVTADGLGNLLAKSPQSFGKFAPTLQKAAQGGAPSLAAAHMMLKKNPKYIEVLEQVAGSENSGEEVTTPPVKTDLYRPSPMPKEAKGETKWANQGMEKLGIDQSQSEAIMKSRKFKSLLIEASGLPAGSKKLEAIKNKITQGLES